MRAIKLPELRRFECVDPFQVFDTDLLEQVFCLEQADYYACEYGQPYPQLFGV